MEERGQTVQSVERALRILESFSLDKPELSLAELSNQTGLSKSTVFRLLATLSGSGYIKQDPVTQKYSLGFKLFHLGAVVIGNMNIRNAALPHMKELSEQVSETVDLNIVNRDERVCIELVESREVIRNFVRVGQRNCLWLGASGKVLLAHLPAADIQRIVKHASATNQLLFGESKLLEDLETIRQQGYAISMEERVKGSFSIAAPLFDYTGELVGGIAAAGPIQRLTEERIPFIIEKVVLAARNISEALGYIGTWTWRNTQQS